MSRHYKWVWFLLSFCFATAPCGSQTTRHKLATSRGQEPRLHVPEAPQVAYYLEHPLGQVGSSSG
jgi:hypothetical protein